MNPFCFLWTLHVLMLENWIPMLIFCCQQRRVLLKLCVLSWFLWTSRFKGPTNPSIAFPNRHKEMIISISVSLLDKIVNKIKTFYVEKCQNSVFDALKNLGILNIIICIQWKWFFRDSQLRALDNVWGHFWLSQLGDDVTDM